MCIFKLAMAERFDERLNWFHQTWHGSPPTCDRKLMAPKKWRIHHFSRANMVSGYFSLLTQLFAWQPSVSVQVVSCSLVRANFLLCACTWKLSWFNQDRHDKPLAVTQHRTWHQNSKFLFLFENKSNWSDDVHTWECRRTFDYWTQVSIESFCFCLSPESNQNSEMCSDPAWVEPNVR